MKCQTLFSGQKRKTVSSICRQRGVNASKKVRPQQKRRYVLFICRQSIVNALKRYIIIRVE